MDQVLADIETLNRAAFEGKYEVTAVSFHAYAHLVDKYALLPHGASMGDRYGPIVVAPQARRCRGEGPAYRDSRHADDRVPALRLYEPAFEYVVVPFDQIQQAVLDGQADAGLLIHEGQLTYQDEGLRKVVDLGEWWAQKTGGLPLPLGGNIIRRDLGPSMIAARVAAAARQHRLRAVAPGGGGRVRPAVRPRAGSRADGHVSSGMYVNDLTLEYGDRGRHGLERLMSEAFERGLIPKAVAVEFAA